MHVYELFGFCDFSLQIFDQLQRILKSITDKQGGQFSKPLAGMLRQLQSLSTTKSDLQNSKACNEYGNELRNKLKKISLKDVLAKENFYGTSEFI